jgi:hypothetical protein
MKDRIDGIVCLWKWHPGEKRDDRHWELVESFPIDMDGHPLQNVINNGGIDSREPWAGWMNTKEPYEDDPEDYDFRPIMGRAATLWNWGSGVQLVGITPPDDWVKWLSVSFYEELCKTRKWISMLEGGHKLYFRTQNAARKILKDID